MITGNNYANLMKNMSDATYRSATLPTPQLQDSDDYTIVYTTHGCSISL